MGEERRRDAETVDGMRKNTNTKRILNHLFFQMCFNNAQHNEKKMITILLVGIHLDGQLVEHGSKGFSIWCGNMVNFLAFATVLSIGVCNMFDICFYCSNVYHVVNTEHDVEQRSFSLDKNEPNKHQRTQKQNKTKQKTRK